MTYNFYFNSGVAFQHFSTSKVSNKWNVSVCGCEKIREKKPGIILVVNFSFNQQQTFSITEVGRSGNSR
jgi:hypothetical protein